MTDAGGAPSAPPPDLPPRAATSGAAPPGAVPPGAPNDLTDTLLAAGTVLATALAVACILLPDRLPFQDLMVRAAFSDAVGAAVSGADTFLQANPWPVHGWLYELVAWPLGLAIGPIAATRLLLAISVASIPLALARLLGAAGLPRVGAAISAPFLLSVPVIMAYVPFVASLPLALLTLAALQRPTPRRSVALLFVATYGMHAFGFVAAALCGGVAALVDGGWRRAGRVVVLALPATALTALTRLVGEAAQGFTYREGPVERLGHAVARVSDVLVSTMDTDLALVVVLVTAAGAALSVGRRSSTAWRGLAAGSLALLGLALVLPEHVARPSIFQMAERFLLPVALLLPAALGLSLQGWRRRLLIVPLAVALLVHSLLLASLLPWGARPAPVERLLAELPAGAVLLNAVAYASDPSSPIAGTIVANDAFRLQAERRGRVIGRYGHPHMPVHYREPMAGTFDGPIGRFVELNAPLVGWVLTDAPPGVLPERGAGWSLAPVADDGGFRLLRVVRAGDP